jgi:hypothetical protein
MVPGHVAGTVGHKAQQLDLQPGVRRQNAVDHERSRLSAARGCFLVVGPLGLEQRARVAPNNSFRLKLQAKPAQLFVEPPDHHGIARRGLLSASQYVGNRRSDGPNADASWCVL